MTAREEFEKMVAFAIKQNGFPSEHTVYSILKDNIVEAFERMLPGLIQKRVMELGFSDCPVSDERLEYIRERLVGNISGTEFRKLLDREIFDTLDWALAKISVMSQDNGYMDGYEAGVREQRVRADNLESELKTLQKQMKEVSDSPTKSDNDLSWRDEFQGGFF